MDSGYSVEVFRPEAVADDEPFAGQSYMILDFMHPAVLDMLSDFLVDRFTDVRRDMRLP